MDERKRAATERAKYVLNIEYLWEEQRVTYERLKRIEGNIRHHQGAIEALDAVINGANDDDEERPQSKEA